MIGLLLASLLAPVAQATPSADLTVWAEAADLHTTYGLGLGGALPLGPVDVEAVGEVGLRDDLALRGHLRGALRWLVAGRAPAWRPSLWLGPGVRLGGEPTPYGAAGLALDAPRLGRLRLRLGAQVHVTADMVPTARSSFTVRWGPRGPAPAPAPAEAPVLAPEASVWIPHPVCQWVPAGEAPRWLERVPPDAELRVRAPGYVPATVEAGQLDQASLAPAPEQGTLIVVGAPGDRVHVGDEVHPVAGDGVLALDRPVGPVTAEVVGGGRVATLEAAVADGYAVWMRAPQPEPLRIRFAADSAELSAEARELLAGVAAAAGEARFVVTGSASSEGDPEYNQRLAARRASTAVAALIEAGLAAARVEDAGPVQLETDAPPEAQRVVIVRPELPEDG